MSQPSRIFSSYRCLGYISNHVPAVIRFVQSRRDHLVITVMEKAFMTFGTATLKLVGISPQHDHDITCITADGRQVFSADKNIIKSWYRLSQQKHTYVGHKKPVHLLLVFGLHLISIDEDSSLKVWEIETAEIYIELTFNNDAFCITAIVHPLTYVNKILLGSKQGTLQLWNVKTGLMIYSFSGFGSPVTALSQAPAIDVMAIGLANGNIIIHNLKYDETVMKFFQEWGPVTALSFRTDGHPILASSGTEGHIAFWNLEERKLQAQIRDAHKCAISGLIFLPEEPLLISNSADNSLKMWILDMCDGGGRLLRFREGHSAPPTRIKFYGDDGQDILSAGEDSTLRKFSIVSDMLNKSLGQASFNRKLAKKVGVRYDTRKMPPIVDFSAEPAREKDWDNIASIHRNVDRVVTWSYDRCCLNDRMLKHEEMRNGESVIRPLFPTCVSITYCGNFVLVGYKTGEVDMFNMQSGLYRGHYGNPKAHVGMVCGVTSDALNQVTITAGIDKEIKFWYFKTKELLISLKVDYIVDRMHLHRESALLALIMDDYSVRMVDIDTKRIVRNFIGHVGKITDLTFKIDGRWLITASSDTSIRTWDIPAGRLIDCFLVSDVCTSLSLSPTGEFLATTHVDNVGIYLWVNHTLYTHVTLKPLPLDYVPQTQELPSAALLDNGVLTDHNQQIEIAPQLVNKQELDDEEFISPEQIANDLVTLSLAADSRWKNLLNLDIIKKRNKPKEPPKVPKSAPFFLPTVAGLQFQFALPEQEDETESRILTSIPFYTTTEFGRSLEQATTKDHYLKTMEMLKKLSPSGIEIEMTSIAPEGGGSVTLMLQFLKMINVVLETNKNFELTQAYLGLFLKMHGLTIAEDEKLCEMCSTVLDAQSAVWKRIQSSLNKCECVVSFLKNAAL